MRATFALLWLGFLVGVALASTTGSENRARHSVDIPLKLPPMRFAFNSSASASATVLLHESLFQKLVAAVLPAIIAEAKSITIPGESQKHFSFDAIHLSEFGIGSVAVGFAAPNKVVVTLTNLVLEVPSTRFAIYDRIIFKITCGGFFSVAIGESANQQTTNIAISFDMNDSNGDLIIDNGVATVTFGYLDVHHSFSNFFCKLGQDIIQLFVGNIDSIIRNLVEKDISPIATKAINAIFSKMAAKLKIPLDAQPVATSDSIQLSVNLLPNQLQSGRDRNVALRSSAFPARDVELFMSQPSVNALLANIQQRGALKFRDVLPINTSIFKELLPAAFNACPNCPIEIPVDFQSPPIAAFAGSATMAFTNLIAGIGGVNASGSVPILYLLLNGTFTAMNWTVTGTEGNVIGFKIAVPTFTMAVYQSSIGPIDVSLIQGLIDFVINDIAVPEFNKKFKGLPIPPIANVTVENFELAFNDAADAGLNIVVPQF